LMNSPSTSFPLEGKGIDTVDGEFLST
jgi:hypothetical protein